MTGKYDRDREGLNTDIKLNTISSKFNVDDQVSSQAEQDLENIKINDEHVVEHVVDLHTLSTFAANAAKFAQDQLSQIKNTLAQINAQPQTDARGAIPFANNKDLKTYINNIAQNISKVPNDSLETERLINLAPQVINNKLIEFIKKRTQTSVYGTLLEAPEIDHLSVEVDKNKGTIDCFYTQLVYSLPLDKLQIVKGVPQAIRAVRIFRAELEPNSIRKLPNLSLNAMSLLSSNNLNNRRINIDTLSILEKSLNKNNISNSVANLSPVDRITNSRIGSEDNNNLNIERPSTAVNLGLQGNPTVSTSLKSFINNKSLDLDLSVANDLSSLRNLSLKLSGSLLIDSGSLAVGKSVIVDANGLNPAQALQIDQSLQNQTAIVVDPNNKIKFRQLAIITPKIPGESAASQNRKMGDVCQFTFIDETVSFGKSYVYYLTCLGNDMQESPRSKLVDVTLDGVRIPANPSNVLVQTINENIILSIAVDDKLVEKFEIYRKDLDRILPQSREIKVIADQKGYNVNTGKREMVGNGFIQVGECASSPNRGGGTYQDKEVIPGKNYIYRVYSVDIFGNKSESPKEIKVSLFDSTRKNNLNLPFILAEVDATTNKAKLTFDCKDERIMGFFLKRKDHTIKQRSFTGPGEVNDLKTGLLKNAFNTHNQEGCVIRGDNLWNGFFPKVDSQIVFIDQTVVIDHIYEYEIIGIDRFGNYTPPQFSRKLLISRTPIVNAPVNLSGSIFYDSGSFAGVKLSWVDGNLEVSAEERVASQATLTDTLVRTLYQIERKKEGEERWEEFPLQQGTEFIDLLESKVGKNKFPFRPNFLQPGNTYAYRIQAYQTGNFISNFTEPFNIFVDAPLLVPLNFKLNTPDPKIKPFYVMLNWDTDPQSGAVDHWEIERAAINNYAAARINFKNISEINNLQFKQFRTIYAESSRFLASTIDTQTKELIKNNIITGEHHFLDSDVVFGQSYFYRIKSVSVLGNTSNWILKGMKINDASFDKKQSLLLTAEEKVKLSDTPTVSNIKNNFLNTNQEKINNSFSLIPNFSKPGRK